MKEQPMQPGRYRIGTGEVVTLEWVVSSRYLRETVAGGGTFFYRQLEDGTYQMAVSSRDPVWTDCELLRIDPMFLDDQDAHPRWVKVFGLLRRLMSHRAA